MASCSPWLRWVSCFQHDLPCLVLCILPTDDFNASLPPLDMPHLQGMQLRLPCMCLHVLCCDGVGGVETTQGHNI